MRIRTKLLFFIIVVLTICTGLLVAVNSLQSRRMLRERTLSDMHALLKARSDQIANVVEQDFERTALVASRTRLRECLLLIEKEETSLQQCRGYRRKMMKILRDARASVGSIKRIHAANKAGIIIASTNEAAVGRALSGYYGQVKKHDQFRLGEMFRKNGQVMYTVYTHMSHPDEDRTRDIGIIATTFRVTRLMGILTDYTHLGKTGELILARDEAKGPRILSPLRHKPAPPLSLQISKGKNMSRALKPATMPQESSGLMKTTDYRGKPSFCAYRHIPAGGWGILAKMDVREVLAPVQKLQTQMAFVAAGVFVLCVVPVLGFTKRLLRPVEALRDGTSAVASGNLDYRVSVQRRDELGALAHAFNSMAEGLKETTASRDELETEIRQRKEAEERQKTALEDLRKSHKEMQDFLYAASHDLQEPLRKIQAFGDRLATYEEAALSAQGQDYLQRVKNAAARMQELIDDLLVLSRVTTRGAEFTPTDLNRVASSVVHKLQHTIDVTAAKVEIDDLPVIVADPGQIEKVLLNLIQNALKFRKEEEPPFVRVYSRTPAVEAPAKGSMNTDSSFCEIVVEDNGIGFDQQHAERIFGMFQKLHPRQKYEGSGIGLTLCARILERHNGTIRAESVPGRGSRFCFNLPLKNKHDQTQERNDDK